MRTGDTLAERLQWALDTWGKVIVKSKGQRVWIFLSYNRRLVHISFLLYYSGTESHLYKNQFKIMSEILGYCLLILLREFQQKQGWLI